MESHLWLITILYMKIWAFTYLQSLNFILFRRMIVYVLWIGILETKWKNEFTFSFKIKTTISFWYANVKEIFTVSPRLIELWGLYTRTFERQIFSLKVDMNISSIALRKPKRSRSDFYSQQSCTSRNQKQEQEELPQQCINKEVTSDSGLFLWLAEYPILFILSHVVSVVSVLSV